MDRNWSRRDFLEKACGSLAALGLGPLLGPSAFPAAGPAAGRRGPAIVRPGGGAGDLPPRVVGLRTQGGSFRFDPVGLRLEPGDGLTWLNMGDFHTTTAFHPDHSDLLAGEVPLRIPEDAAPWHSDMLGLTGGVEFSYTFEVPGVYDYFCQPHYSFGMVGRVVAGEPRGGPAVTRPISELNEASRKQMPSVDAIMGPGGRTFEWAARLNGVLAAASGDGDAAAAARAVATGMAEDAELQEVLSAAGEAGRVRSRVEKVVAGAEEGIRYDALLGRADAAKEALRAAR